MSIVDLQTSTNNGTPRTGLSPAEAEVLDETFRKVQLTHRIFPQPLIRLVIRVYWSYLPPHDIVKFP